MADRKFEKKLARRMVALAIKPYLTSERKMKRLYHQAVLYETATAVETSAAELLRIRRSMQAMQSALDTLKAKG